MVEQRTWDSAWLDRSVFQLLKNQVKAKAPWLKVIWVSLKVILVYSNPEKNFWLNACVLLGCESLVATPDPLLSLALLRE